MYAIHILCCLFKKCRYPKKRTSRDDTVVTPAQKPLSNFIIKPGCFGRGSVEGIVFASAEMPLVYARVSPVSDCLTHTESPIFVFGRKLHKF